MDSLECGDHSQHSAQAGGERPESRVQRGTGSERRDSRALERDTVTLTGEDFFEEPRVARVSRETESERERAD